MPVPLSKLLPFSLLLLAAPRLWAAEGPVTMERDIRPVLQKYCLDCHNPDKAKGDVNLTDLLKNPHLLENRDVWAKVAETMEKGDMPPEKKPQPQDGQRKMIINFLDGELSKLDCTTPQNPGRVTIRRLNREEYRNTVRDLLRVDFRTDDFPNDEVGYGFDNIGDVLSLSPMLMEKYLAAAEEIATRAIVTGPPKAEVRKFRGNQFEPVSKEAAGIKETGEVSFSSAGEATRKMEFPAKGEYLLRFKACGDQAGAEPAHLQVKLDGKVVGELDVPAQPNAPATYELKVSVDKNGWHLLSLGFTNDYFDLKNANPKLRGDRNLSVLAVEQQLPAGALVLPPSHQSLISKMPAPGQELATARELLRPLVKRAYRRPVTEAEVEQFVHFVDLALQQKGSFLEGMQVAVQAVLCAPQFLFRWELDPGKVAPNTVRDLSDYELASRLSYFLWSSLPDDKLTQLADKGELRQGDNLHQQIVRMLGDWKAQALVQNFAGQWLQIRGLNESSIDYKAFPRWTDDLRPLMRQETEMFFSAIMKEDRNVLDLLDARFTFLNEKLARYYGVDGVKGKEMQRVELPPASPRGGVLTMGSVLFCTSTPTRTSPVIRGKWILEQILGTPPPAAPPDVPPLNEQSQVNQTASLRERLGAHSRREECAGCHKRMDPLGFALENFDATGAWRQQDGKFPIDSSGVLPDGRSFAGPNDLKQVLKQGDGFVSSFAEKLMTYALGRGLDHHDLCAVKSVVDQAKAKENKFSALVEAIVTSEPFRRRTTADKITQR